MKKLRPLKLTFLLLFLSSTIAFAQELYADFSYFPKIEFNDKIVGSKTDDKGATFEKIVIDGFDSKIPFYFISPKDRKEVKFVILLHGITSNKESWLPPSNNTEKNIYLLDLLLAEGYSVIIPDAKYHGERSYEGNFTSPIYFFPSQDCQKVYNMFATTVKDIRILMDYFQSRFADTSITFDVVGYSMGGMLSIYLNSADNRLHRVVACVTPLDAQKGSKIMGMTDENAKKMKNLSVKNYATVQKSPITLLMGTKDLHYSTAEVEDFFEKIAITDKALKFYESGHALPHDYIFDAIKSLNKE
ncbi:alpha/beta hydrolase [Aestuariivivens insulae]|uniref:alpha/beta hydrolase n=1 Tax=Aestuariivivens insulae TaxID=1621988 RepID=UPI001F5A67C3|nr:alpha/beta fold hydrolase [Aestuariivivens insulae]